MLAVLTNQPHRDIVGEIPRLILLTAILIFLIFVARKVLGRFRATAARFGYAAVRQYLRAIPQTEAERADAIELTMRGGLICLLGAVFPLLVLIGSFPLYYGIRKLLYLSFARGIETPPGA